MIDIKSWQEVTVKLLVPGSSKPPLKWRIEQVQAISFISPEIDLGMTAVFDPNTQKTYFTLGSQDFYISDKSGMIGCSMNFSVLVCNTSYFDYTGGLDKAIKEFASEFDASRINTGEEVKDGKKYFFRINLISAAPEDFFNAGTSMYAPWTNHTIEMTDGILHIDWHISESRGGKYTGVAPVIGQPSDYGHTGSSADFWIDLKAKKVIKSVVDGFEMDLSSFGQKDYANPLKKN